MNARQLAERLGGIDDRYIQEARECLSHPSAAVGRGRLKKRAGMRRAAVLAALLCALLTLSAAAIAGNWFGLRDLLLPEQQEVKPPRDPDTGEQEPYMADMISLAGFADTPESRATAEWQAFLASCDLDGFGNDIFGEGTSYIYYQVYTQEMADKLEEIAAKYGLKLHTDMVDDLYTDEALCAQVGGDFLGENRSGSAYMYEDGTFKFDGELDLAGYGHLDYQFQRCVRGSFTDIQLNIRDIDSYTEWAYTTASGVPATLALAPHKALIIVDLPDSFVTVNVLAGTETSPGDIFSSGPIDAEDLERFADSFDFSILAPARPADPDLARPSLEEALGKPTPEEFYRISGIGEPEAQSFYASFMADVESGERMAVAERILYPVTVTWWNTSETGTYLVSRVVESPEEFLPYYDDIFTTGLWESISEDRYDMERSDLIPNNGMVGAAGGAIWFAETADGGIGILTIQNSEGCSVRQSVPEDTAPAHDRSRPVFAKLLEDLYYAHVLPDGRTYEAFDEMEYNWFALMDVNGDGVEELILLFTNTYTADQAGYVLAYDAGTQTVCTELLEYPLLTFYDNGYVKAGWSHNQGAAGDSLWPYTLYRYDAAEGRYVAVAMVDAWDRSFTETHQGESFPEEADRSGTGVVYYVMTEGAYDASAPMDAAEYEAWLDTWLTGAAELDIPYQNITEENIGSI